MAILMIYAPLLVMNWFLKSMSFPPCKWVGRTVHILEGKSKQYTRHLFVSLWQFFLHLLLWNKCAQARVHTIPSIIKTHWFYYFVVYFSLVWCVFTLFLFYFFQNVYQHQYSVIHYKKFFYFEKKASENKKIKQINCKTNKFVDIFWYFFRVVVIAV